MLVAAYSLLVAAHNKTFRCSDISSNEHHTVVVQNTLRMFEMETVEKWMTCLDCYIDCSNDRILDIQSHCTSLHYPTKDRQRMTSRLS